MNEQFEDRIARIADAPAELQAYRAWLAALDTSGPRDYLFADKRTRFEPKREDVVVTAGTLTVADTKGRTIVRSVDHGVTIPVPEVGVADAERMLSAIDGERCLLEVQLDSGLEPIVLARVLRATFGRVVLAPAAVSELEARVPGVEITRFPGAPYAIMRAYWNNMAAVRKRLANVPTDREDYVAWLRRLHVVALMGERLDSFYKPASPGADRGVSPGALFLDDVVLREGTRGTLFLSGPRVNAKLIGGDAYHRAIYRSVDDVEALTRVDTVTEDDIAWGRVVVARSERDPEPGPWFCPPRPLRAEHVEQLATFHAALTSSSEASDVVVAAAHFHWCFVRLHPFHNGNQSIAMNIVNAALAAHGLAGIPHLVLDHFALRLRRGAYARLFARAVAAYGIAGEPATRLNTLMAGNDASYRFIDRIARAAGDDVDALVAAHPDEAAFALLAPD